MLQREYRPRWSELWSGLRRNVLVQHSVLPLASGVDTRLAPGGRRRHLRLHLEAFQVKVPLPDASQEADGTKNLLGGES